MDLRGILELMYAKDTHAHTYCGDYKLYTYTLSTSACVLVYTCMYTCVHTVFIAKWSLFECVESVVPLKEQLVGRVGYIVSHATFAILYQAIVERTMF